MDDVIKGDNRCYGMALLSSPETTLANAVFRDAGKIIVEQADRIEALEAENVRLLESGKIAALLLECATGAALWTAEPGTTLAEIRQALKGPTDAD